MRLHPSPSPEEVYDWLRIQIGEVLDPAMEPELETTLRGFAEAMVAISEFALAEPLSPLLP